MSLADALLLEACPLDVWIALRTDGAKGSGIENDPFNGAPRYEPALAVSSLSASGREATATSAASHGYAVDEVVTISGVSGSDGQFYNGTFVIHAVPSTTTFKYWMAGAPGGSGGGTMQCARTHYRFDELLENDIGANTTIHLGPGLSLTQGYWQGGTIRIKTKQKIIGSGMGVTTLKLVNASRANSSYAVIGTLATGGELRHFEVSDLTLDCNLDGQLVAGMEFPSIGCAGIVTSGAHLRYRRVRVINFGSLQSTRECFVLWSAGAHPDALVESVDCVVEDCVVEQPAINQSGLTTCIHMGSTENGIGIQGYHRASVIRNCLIDCEYKRNPAGISQLTRSGTTATATTIVPHGRAVNDWVRVSGAVVSGSTDNPFNGSFQITAVTTTTIQYTMVSTPATNASGEMWLDRFSSHFVPVVPGTGIVKSGSGPYTITVTTLTPHFRVPGDNVMMNNAAPAAYNGSFRVTEVLGPRQLRFVVQTDPGTPTAWGFLGVSFQGVSNDGGSEAVVEGNRIFNTRIGGPYHDTHSSKGSVVRNNHYRNVVTGPYQRLAGLSGPTPAATISRIGNTATFTIDTARPHGFTVGQAVQIRGAKIGGEDAPPGTFNGEFAILAVPTPTSFTYDMDDVPSADADGGTGTVRALWQVQECRIENNVIDLIPSLMSWGAPIALVLVAVPPVEMTPFRVFRRLQVRNNVIRNTDNLSEPVVRNQGIVLGYCEQALIENNVIDLQVSNPIQYSSSASVRCFNNRDSSGKLIQGYSGGLVQDELTTFIEDAAIVCLL